MSLLPFYYKTSSILLSNYLPFPCYILNLGISFIFHLSYKSPAILTQHNLRFVPLDPTVDANDKNSNCAEVSSIWLVANFQYIFAVVAYSVDKPFRKPFYTNSLYFNFILILQDDLLTRI